MRWSKFILLTERGKVDIFATWKIIDIMTCSTTADVRAIPLTKTKIYKKWTIVHTIVE